MSASAIYAGAVIHQRLRPVRHRLRYAIFDLLLDLDELPGLARRLRLFSYERFNLFAFHERDHGDGVAGGLRQWVESHLTQAGLTPDGGTIRVLCMPRILGHAFNPISVFYCARRSGAPLAMLYEVNNTFGERHTYLIPAAAGGHVVRQECKKRLYVSPFLPMDLTYRFRVTPPDEQVSIGITASDSQGVLIATVFSGTRQALTDWTLLLCFLRMPVLGLRVLIAIHFQALILWCRGLRLQHRPVPPSAPVSINP